MNLNRIMMCLYIFSTGTTWVSIFFWQVRVLRPPETPRCCVFIFYDLTLFFVSLNIIIKFGSERNTIDSGEKSNSSAKKLPLRPRWRLTNFREKCRIGCLPKAYTPLTKSHVGPSLSAFWWSCIKSLWFVFVFVVEQRSDLRYLYPNQIKPTKNVN